MTEAYMTANLQLISYIGLGYKTAINQYFHPLFSIYQNVYICYELAQNGDCVQLERL